MPSPELLAQLGIAGVFIYLYFDLSKRNGRALEQKDLYIQELVDKFVAVAKESSEAMTKIVKAVEANNRAVDSLTLAVRGGLPARKKA